MAREVVEDARDAAVAEEVLAVVFCRSSEEIETLGEIGGAEARA